MKGYRTVAKASESEYVIQKSRFIGRAYPLQDEESVQEQIEMVRKNQWDATHHCYAYILGADGMVQRYSDDGEPQGTAGIPMLEVLKQRELTDTLVISTRYYGGIQLGAGGLVRAYSKSTVDAIDAAGIAVMEQTITLQLVCDYSLWDRLQGALEQMPVLVGEVAYTEIVTAFVQCKCAELLQVKQQLISLSNGTIQIEEQQTEYIAWPQ